MEIYETGVDKSLVIEVGDIVEYCSTYCMIVSNYNAHLSETTYGMICLKTGQEYWRYSSLEEIVPDIDSVCKNEHTKLELKKVKYL